MRSIFYGKVAIVTGGASGIGLALGKLLAQYGCKTILSDIQQEALNKEVGKLRYKNYSVEKYIADVTDANDVQGLVSYTLNNHGRIDYMINNAGITTLGEAYKMTLDHWYRLLDVNLKGVIHGVHSVYPVMIKQGFGHIVNISSMAGLTPSPLNTAYATTKYAIVGLSTSLRIEGEAFGVNVSVACPSITKTPQIKTMEILQNENMNLSREDIIQALFRNPLSDTECAQKIIEGIAANRDIILVNTHSKIRYLQYRYFPTYSKKQLCLLTNKIRTLIGTKCETKL